MDAEELFTLGKQIAVYLHYPTVTQDDYKWNPSVDLLCGDDNGLGIRISNDQRNEGRLAISAILGKLFEHKAYGDNLPSITVSASKSAAQIVADINRRLLPDFRAVVAHATEHYQANQRYNATTEDTARRCQAASGGKLEVRMPGAYHSRSEQPTLYANKSGVCISGNVSGDHVTFSTLTLTVAQAERVFAALFAA